MTVVAPPAPWLALFNRPGFLALRDLPATLLVAEDAAALGGVLTDGHLVSGASAPYGGIDLLRPREAPERVVALVDALLDAARDHGAERLTLRLAPAAHAPETAELVQFALLNRGFRVVDADLAAVLDLRAVATPGDYVAQLRSPARRALKHAAAEPFSVTHAGDAAAWDAGWALLEDNRARKGRALSLDRDDVEALRTAFPDEVRLLELRHAGVVVAAAFSVRVRRDVELVVAWGDADHGLERSPMNRLALAVVERALAERVAVVDLGTSTDPATPVGRRAPNAGLCRFKASIGARSQVRYVLEGTP